MNELTTNLGHLLNGFKLTTETDKHQSNNYKSIVVWLGNE